MYDSASERRPPPGDLLDGASLFLDFDGTLVDLAPQPDAVAVNARLAALIDALSQRLDGRIAVISGRPVAQIRALFGDPAFAIGGSHGLELVWPDGRAITPARPPSLDSVLAEMEAFAQERPGVLVEPKPFGAALHYRRAPDRQAECHALAERLAHEVGLHLQPGKMMVELRPPGADKGAALRTFMQDAAMAGARPIFLGDDLTDEPGFVAAADLGGAGVLVGADRASAATWRLESVADTLDWLEASARAPA